MGKKINLFLLTVFFVLFSLSTLVLAVDCSIPDTGQTKCYDNGHEIPCPQPGEPFYGQDAHYTCNPQSYTKLDENGNDLPESETAWVMVRDNVTGLIWENKTDDGDIHDKNNKYDWYIAQELFIATLNSAPPFGGFSDWRLPTVKELSFIRNIGIHNPSINTDYFPNTQSYYYWSSTTLVGYYQRLAWLVGFYYGGIRYGDKPFRLDFVRAVRGDQSYNNFIDNGDATVTDTSIGLMWQKDTAPGTYTWQQALSYCESLSFAGYSDWRLPDINELQSLVNYRRLDPSIDPVFRNTVSSPYWSSTTNAKDPYYAWGVNFGGGDIGCYGYKLGSTCVRAVRGPVPITTTTTIVNPPCPVESLYGEHSEEVAVLNNFRVNVLSQTPEGQEIIKLYYQWSPVIVEMMKQDKELKEEVKKMIDGVLGLLRESEKH